MDIKVTTSPVRTKYVPFRQLVPGDVFSVYCNDEMVSTDALMRSLGAGPGDPHNTAVRLRDGQTVIFSLDCKVVPWSGTYNGRADNY